MLVDTHCHLDASEFDADRTSVLQRAQAAGVGAIVVPAVSPQNFDAVRALAHGNDNIVYALGIHPLWSNHVDETAIESLEQALVQARNDTRLVAVGEIGLDYFVPGLDPERQEALYQAQLRLARRYDLPVILHVRRSQDRLLKYLRRIEVSGGIAHAFNGSIEQANQFISRGFALGFGGAMTYARALQIRRLAAGLPPGAHVLETDAPDIPPQWHRGARNEPHALAGIASALAQCRGQTVEQTVAHCWQNACRVLPRLAAGITNCRLG